jgi:hypothetical protein
MKRFRALVILAAAISGFLTRVVPAEEPPQPVVTKAVPLTDLQLQQYLVLVRGAGYYGLRDPEEAKAIAELRKHPEQAAPELARMLADGHGNRRRGWIEVYRPMYIMQGMGPALKVAVPKIAEALSDEHGINVGKAAELLTEIGPDAKEAMPALLQAWEKVEASKLDARRKQLQKNMLAKAMLAVDSEAAKQAGVSVVGDEK